MHDAQGAAGNAHGKRDFGGVVIHQHHVCGFDGGVRTQRTHGDAHVCAGQHRCIVDAVTHKGKVFFGLLCSKQLFDLVHLVAGQKTGVVLVQTQLLRHRLRHRLCIAGQHDRLAHAGSLQSADSIGAVGLYHVRNQQITCIAALYGNVHDGAHALYGGHGDAQLFHQAGVTGGNGPAIYLRGHAMTAQFLHVRDPGGFKAYVLLILIVMLGCSLFGTGSTAYYVLVIGLLSTLPYSKQLPPSKVLMPAGFAANHPLLPFNTALQYGIVIAVLQSAGVAANVNLVKFSLVNLCLSIGFLVWCILAYKIMPDHPIAEAKEEALHAGEQKVALTKNQELITYFSFVLAVVGMILQSKIGDAGYAITGLAVGVILISGVMDFNEIRNSISAPIILMSAGVIGIADALGNTGLTSLVGETVAKMLGTNVNPFVLIFAFCILTSLLATLTGSTIGTVYVFAPMAIATCVNLGLDPTAAAAAIVVSGWCGHFLPIDGMPAMIMGAGDYKITEFWKFTIPQYFIRLLALTVGAVLIFPMK